LVPINEKVRVDYQFEDRESLGIEVPSALLARPYKVIE